MASYHHKQYSPLMVAVGSLMAVSTMVLALVVDGTGWLWAVAPLSALPFAMFWGLRTSVDHEAVRVAFTFGWPKRTFAIDAIEAHAPARNRWHFGWGIRLVPGGWMFNVWGFDAVDVTYRTKEKIKTFRIGTDDPNGLNSAIASALDAGTDGLERTWDSA